MTSLMYDILKPSVLWKIWRRGLLISFLEGGSDGLDPALVASHFAILQIDMTYSSF